MTKSKNNPRRSAKSSNDPINTRSAAKPTGNSGKNQNGNRTATAAKKEKRALAAAKSTPPDVVDKDADETMVQAPSDEYRLSVNTNSINEAIVLCPISIRLTDLFLQIDDTSKSEIRGYEFKDRAFESEDDKEVETLLKTGAMLLDKSNPGPKVWYDLFSQVFGEDQKGFKHTPDGAKMRDFCFNLAASDPLSLFEPEEIDKEGNLYECALASAWLASTLIHGSLHLFYDFELLQNRMNAQVEADNEEEEHSEFLVVTVGDPSPAWNNMSPDEKQNSKAFTYSQRYGEDAKDRSIKDAVETCAGYFKIKAEHMTVAKWIVAFSDATTEGSSQSSEIAYNLRLVGSDLALTSPDIIFMVHEWIDKEHLRPQTHSYVWLAAVSVFGPLWAHHDSLLEAAVQDMHISEEEAAEEPGQPMHEASDASTVASADTAPQLDKTHFNR